MYEFLEYRVSDFMSRNGIVVSPNTPLEDAERVFERHDFNLLPVVEGQRLVGVLTKLDFLKAFSFGPGRLVPHYREILEQKVGAFMMRNPMTVSPDMPLTKVLEKIVATRCRAFPVVEGDVLVGVISREDVVAALRRAAASKATTAQRK
ncbi:MAG TPA: CBS domain-containing protein [Candidatus Binatia bacterium]|nr:CBS domain-containing protein [Candidatus Binatia bacterium]